MAIRAASNKGIETTDTVTCIKRGHVLWSNLNVSTFVRELQKTKSPCAGHNVTEPGCPECYACCSFAGVANSTTELFNDTYVGLKGEPHSKET
jgi:hypothetical protein